MTLFPFSCLDFMKCVHALPWFDFCTVLLHKYIGLVGRNLFFRALKIHKVVRPPPRLKSFFRQLVFLHSEDFLLMVGLHVDGADSAVSFYMNNLICSLWTVIRHTLARTVLFGEY